MLSRCKRSASAIAQRVSHVDAIDRRTIIASERCSLRRPLGIFAFLELGPCRSAGRREACESACCARTICRIQFDATTMPDSVEPDVRRFIASHITSVAQLELLLLLRAHPEKYWSCEDAAKQLYVSAEVTASLLARMAFQQLLRAAENQSPRFKYAPASAQLEQVVNRLADLYEQRRVTVISLIYSEPIDKLRSFADAFRLRKPKEE